MRLLLIVAFLSGCSHTKNLKPSDTKFDESKRNWAQIYEHELKVAKENEDYDAFRFFWPEYLKELYRLRNK